MKKILSVLIALSIIFAFAGCGAKDTQQNKLKEITVCLEWTPNTNHTGLYVAEAMGFYEEEGIKVRIVQPPEDGSALMCASGEAQFAVGAQDTLASSFAMDEPLPVTAVAALLQHNTSGIISGKADNIKSPKCLENRTYSTWNDPTELATIKYLMEKEGADFGKLRLIPNVITDEVGALEHNDTDAIWIFYGWGGINAEYSGFDFEYFNFIDIDSVFDYYTPILIANNAFLENEAETARAFLAATKKGYLYAAENPEEAAKMLISGDTTGSLSDLSDFVTKSQEWISAQYVADAESWGVIDPQRWDGFYKWLWDNSLIEKELAPGTGFSNEFLS